MAQKDYMDLLELQLRIREAVGEAFEGRYWVKAEISSWSPRTNGHCYLELSQSQGGRPVAQSRAMIWKWYYPRLKAFFEQTTGQALQAGITVLVKVQVSYSELYGISLFIEDIDPAFTLGEKGGIWKCRRNWPSRTCRTVWRSLRPRRPPATGISAGTSWRTPKATLSGWTCTRP